MKKNLCGIYWIIAPSGNAYIGSSRCMRGRRKTHFIQMRRGDHHCQALQRAWGKYGDELKFEVLQICEKERLFEFEQFWMDNALCVCNGIYNSSKTANSGGNFTEEGLRRRMEYLKTTSVSPEMREQIRQKLLGRPFSEERKANVSKALRGRKLSIEHCDKVSVNSKKNYEKIKDTFRIPKGHKFSEETRAKMKASQMERRAKKAEPNSKYRGVCYANKTWKANIGFQGKAYFIGRYRTELEAARAYNAKAIELGVDPIRLNVIEET